MAVGFWRLDHPARAPAVISDTGRALSYGELREGSDRFSASLQHQTGKTLGFVLCRNSPGCLLAYLGALRSGQAVCLLEAGLPNELLRHMLETYLPDWLFAEEEIRLDGFVDSQLPQGLLYRRVAGHNESLIAPDLALLLTTSGSTGSPKLVRLSFENLQANAESIAAYLGITSEDRALASLPMSYSYGLSVLNSHLLLGSKLLLTNSSLLQRDYWNFVKEQQPTSLVGVPFQYELMLRLKVLEKEMPGLQTLTQAGGRLDPARIAQIERISSQRGWRFFVMYGQTEATARISYVPPERLREKVGSVGIAIPGGKLSLDQESNELLYAGRNVMLGYAHSRSDLAKGDELRGQLRTGDLARRDDHGYYYIVGRLKRMLKVYGKRVSLDEMETLIGQHCGGSVACYGRDDNVCVAVENSENEEIAARVIKDLLLINPKACRIVTVPSLPRLSNSKVDYQSLSSLEGR